MMWNSIKTVMVTAIALMALSLAAQAEQRFEAKAFQAAQAAGKSIVVDVTAPWCPVCKKQRPIVERLEKEKPNVIVYEIDFDTSKDLLKHFGVQMQSTLIAFKGDKEVDRLTGETDPERLRTLFDKSL